MFRRDLPGSPYELTPPRASEVRIPVLGQVRQLLGEERYVQAVTLAYQTVVVDLQRAYRNPFPPYWTHKDVLQWARRVNLGPATDHLVRLYQLYEPIRYGPTMTIVPGDVLGPLASLYAQSALWRIYESAPTWSGALEDGSAGGGGPRALGP